MVYARKTYSFLGLKTFMSIHIFLQAARSDIATQDEDPFDSLTDKIPQKPVTFVEGASYSFIILVGFAVAGFAAYGVFKELIFEPKE